MIPPAPLNKYPQAPSFTAQHPHANYSSDSPGVYASSSGRDYGPPQQQQMLSSPAPHEPPVPSDPSWNSSTDRAVMIQFSSPGESVSSSGILSYSLIGSVSPSVPRPFSSNYLPGAFAAQSMDKSNDVWIGDKRRKQNVLHETPA